jgi:hypothetical protein
MLEKKFIVQEDNNIGKIFYNNTEVILYFFY